jgi:D-3-phosphoglycerate dehydrogenase
MTADGRFRVMVTDEVDPEGIALLRGSPRIEVVERPTLPPAELLEEIAGYDALIGRSATRITGDLLERGERLRVIGRAGVGVDNIDLERATELGIAVINAPGGNTVSVAELFFGVLISLVRHLGEADASMRAGRWDRSLLGGTELRGRTLAIVGLGRIGGEVARRARAFGMTVIAFDPYVSAARFEELGVERVARLADALDRADVLTLHVPLTDETRGMIGAPELSRLGSRALVLNLARGGIVAEDALVDAVRAGRIGGAALDVFAREPLAPDHPLRTLPGVLLTPHLGASTSDAQRSVSIEACAAVRDALVSGDLSGALNAAGVGGAGWAELRPLMALAERLGRLGRCLLPAGWSCATPAPARRRRAPSSWPPSRARSATSSTGAPSTWSTCTTWPPSAASRRRGRRWPAAASWATRWSCAWTAATAASAWAARSWARRTAASPASAPSAWTWRRAGRWWCSATTTSPASSGGWGRCWARPG